MTEREVLNDWRPTEKVTMVNAPFNIGTNVTIINRSLRESVKDSALSGPEPLSIWTVPVTET